MRLARRVISSAARRVKVSRRSRSGGQPCRTSARRGARGCWSCRCPPRRRSAAARRRRTRPRAAGGSACRTRRSPPRPGTIDRSCTYIQYGGKKEAVRRRPLGGAIPREGGRMARGETHCPCRRRRPVCRLPRQLPCKSDTLHGLDADLDRDEEAGFTSPDQQAPRFLSPFRPRPAVPRRSSPASVDRGDHVAGADARARRGAAGVFDHQPFGGRPHREAELAGLAGFALGAAAALSGSSSPTVTASVLLLSVAPDSSVALVPGFTAATSGGTSAERSTVLPLTPRSTSPGLMPAFSAGLPFSTARPAPRAAGRGRRTARAPASLPGSRRRCGRARTLPFATSWSFTSLATSIGIANAMPW